MAMPLVLPRTNVIAHELLDKRGLWELNSEVGWYIGLAINHYHYLECYSLRTRETRYYNTVKFISYNIPFSIVRLKDFLIQAATNIITILTQLHKKSM